MGRPRVTRSPLRVSAFSDAPRMTDNGAVYLSGDGEWFPARHCCLFSDS